MQRRAFLTGLAASCLGTGMSRAQSGTEQTPASQRSILRVRDSSSVKLLQFTDIHFFCKEKYAEADHDRRSVDLMKRLVERAEPDLLLVTGDLWHENPDGRGEEFMRFAVKVCSSLGVPWAFSWGNHDKLDDVEVGHRTLREAKHSLYRGGRHEGNYRLELVDATGATQVTLFCLDSGIRGLQGADREWLASQAKGQGFALGVFHIPVLQYNTVWQRGEARGVKLEDVCFEKEDGSSLAALKRLGVRACVCGHDHVNDYDGAEEGIELIYGRATGYGGYGGAQLRKGAKLYTLDCPRKSLRWVSLLDDGTTWEPPREPARGRPRAESDR